MMTTEKITDESVTEAADDAAVRTAFDACVSDGKDEDSTKMAMIAAGAKFKNVTRLFTEYMVDAGLLKTKEEKNDILADALTGKNLEDEEVFNSCVDSVAKGLGVSERSAAGSLRQWAKKNEIGFFKKPKSSGSGRSGITSKILDFIVDKPTATEAELVAYLEEVGTANTMKHKTLYIGILASAGKIAAKYA